MRVAPAPVLTPPMLTLQFGRAMLGQGAGCQPLAGQPTIFDVAGELQRRGMFAVGVVVPDRTGETAALCVNGNLHSSWADLARLRDEFRWSFVSNGQSRLDLAAKARSGKGPGIYELKSLDTLPPIPDPQNMLNAAVNYVEHGNEMARAGGAAPVPAGRGAPPPAAK